MLNAYYNNNSTSNGVSYRVLRDSTSIKEGDWCFYLHNNQYARDYYPTVVIFGFDEPGSTNAITYKLQGRKYSGESSRFATQFGDHQSGTNVGDTIVMKLEELSV